MSTADAILTHLGFPSNGARKWINRHLKMGCCESTVWGHPAQTAGLKEDKQEQEVFTLRPERYVRVSQERVYRGIGEAWKPGEQTHR